MKSHVSKQFLKLLANMPLQVQQQAHAAYRQFKKDPNHPGTYSARVTKSYRVLGTMRNGEIYWYWIGSHAEYDKLINP